MTAEYPDRPEGFRRVAEALAERGHPHAPLWLEVAARTSQEAADALGVAVGQIAKSVIFRRKADAVAVLVVTSGDRRVDEKKVAARVGALGRADADFVKAHTGFTIGGVSPLAHASP
jgi:prolyl-tRNA editing enzyme YbaK/EbsC (Cys-tRNA(Pro) deacylase)